MLIFRAVDYLHAGEQLSLAPVLTPEQIEQQYQKLRAAHAAGHLSWPNFVEQVRNLRGQDATGNWWTINPYDGAFLRYDGRQWVPVGQTPTAEVQVSAPAKPPPAVRAQSSRRGCASPGLGLALALGAAVFWFVYSSLLPSSESMDCITPIILGGLPLGLRLLGGRLDGLLRPFSFLGHLPRPLRTGMAVALPVVLGLVLSLLSDYGYGALQITAFVSILASYALLRVPRRT